jgi:hypothetical protein
MGEARRRGTFEERRAEAVGNRKESWRRRNRRPHKRPGAADAHVATAPAERDQVTEPTERDLVMARLSTMGFNRGVRLITAPGKGRGDRGGK